MLTDALKAPNAATVISEFIFTPPHNAITQNIMPINPAVLRLGCSIMNKIKSPKETNEIIFFSFFTKFQCANKLADSRMQNGFISSDGCIFIGPNINHLVDPLIALPKNIVEPIRKSKI